MADRPATIEINADSRSLPAQLRAAFKQVSGFAAASSRAIGKFAAPYAKQIGRAAARGGQRAFDSAASFVVNTAVEVREFETNLVRMQQSGDLSAATVDALRTQIRGLSRDTGVGSDMLLEAASAFLSQTGDAAGAAREVDNFAKVWMATGAAMKEVAAIGATMQDNLRVAPGDMLAGYSAVAAAGQAGNVEFAEMAKLVPELAASFTKFEGGFGLEGLRTGLAMFQAVNRDFRNANKSQTSLLALSSALDRSAGKLHKLGVEVFDKNHKRRGALAIVDDLAKKLQKNPKLLAIDILGDATAVAALNALITNRGLVDEVSTKSGNTETIDKGAMTWAESSAGRINKSLNEAKEAVAAAFTPERIKMFADAMGKAAAAVIAVANALNALYNFGDGAREGVEDFRSGQQGEQRALAIMNTGVAAGAPVTQTEAQARVDQEAAAYNDLINGRVSGEDFMRARGGRQGDPWGTLGALVDNKKAVEDAVAAGVAKGMAAAPPATAVIGVGGADTVKNAAQGAPANRRKP